MTIFFLLVFVCPTYLGCVHTFPPLKHFYPLLSSLHHFWIFGAQLKGTRKKAKSSGVIMNVSISHGQIVKKRDNQSSISRIKPQPDRQYFIYDLMYAPVSLAVLTITKVPSSAFKRFPRSQNEEWERSIDNSESFLSKNSLGLPSNQIEAESERERARWVETNPFWWNDLWIVFAFFNSWTIICRESLLCTQIVVAMFLMK